MTGRPTLGAGVWRRAVVLVATAALAPACGPTEGSDPAIGETRSGGDATAFDKSTNAFGSAIPSLDRLERRAFAVGNSFFNDNWVIAPASTDGRDGLGPLFNAQSCSSCHLRDGRAQPPADEEDPARGLLLRLSVPGTGSDVMADPVYGDQLQDRAILGVPAEAMVRISYREVHGRYRDGERYTLLAPTYEIVDLAYGSLDDDVLVSPRIAPAIFGVGLLEAVPERTVLAGADPDDTDHDGISGRPNWVHDARTDAKAIGRFGWKANVPSVEQQNAGAFNSDIGITNRVFPDQPCSATQAECIAAPNGGSPELDDEKLARVTFYTRTLAVPARREVESSMIEEGEQRFRDAGCASCHQPTLRTGDSDIDALATQTIHPYTDLLIHDLGPGLEDGRPDGDATGREWRTPPLWGIGLQEAVSGHTRLLHDGRARNLAEAILWHGGEARRARDAFRKMSREDREALLAFLRSL